MNKVYNSDSFPLFKQTKEAKKPILKLQTPEKIKTEERIGLGSGSDVESEMVVITPRRRQSLLDLSPGVKAGMTPKLKTLNAVSPTLALRRRSSGG